MSISNMYEWLNSEKQRFYKIKIKKCGTQLKLDHNGSCVSNRGGSKSLSVNNSDDAKKQIDKMKSRRKSRGYDLISFN